MKREGNPRISSVEFENFCIDGLHFVDDGTDIDNVENTYVNGKQEFMLEAPRTRSGLPVWDLCIWNMELQFIMQMHYPFMIILLRNVATALSFEAGDRPQRLRIILWEPDIRGIRYLHRILEAF